MHSTTEVRFRLRLEAAPSSLSAGETDAHKPLRKEHYGSVLQDRLAMSAVHVRYLAQGVKRSDKVTAALLAETCQKVENEQ